MIIVFLHLRDKIILLSSAHYSPHYSYMTKRLSISSAAY